ncbi:hypothetical protein ACFFGV_12585 [Pontibacillus salicampi]|uniref:Uncharacterized protein n=1 Tax=Pontibacillus salicampi TaxID=1449801 RepID=A0ABV6LQ54_9BACI
MENTHVPTAPHDVVSSVLLQNVSALTAPPYFGKPLLMVSKISIVIVSLCHSYILYKGDDV